MHTIDPVVTRKPGTLLFELTLPLEVSLPAPPYGVVRIEPPFVTDGASVPRAAWPFVGSPFQPDSLRGAVVHDFFYQGGEPVPGRGAPHRVPITKEQADFNFRAMLIEDDVGRERALVFWLAVRVGGRGHWHRARGATQ